MLSTRTRLDVLATAVAALLVGLPALLTYDGFMYDYTNHLWLVWVQGHAIAEHGAPTYFLHTAIGDGGVFDPFYMFYGGTLYALTGALSAALGGSARIAYVAVILFSVAAAYGGTLWLARQLGARSWLAHAPAVTFVASAYYVTNLYGRGAWPEFVAVSAIPLLLAAGTHIARAPRPRPLPCALFVLAAVVWSGSHNITLAWATVVIAATIAALRLLLGRPLVASRRRLGALLGLLALAGCVNAWFLLPNVLNAHNTRIGELSAFSWSATGDFNTPRTLFDPLRHVPASSGTPALFVQVPLWMLVWALSALIVLRGRIAMAHRRAAAATAIVLGGLLALVMVAGLWHVVPKPLQLIQFPYRLSSYIALLIAGLALIAVLVLQDAGPGRRRRLLTGALAGAMAVSIGLSQWQLWVPETRLPTSYTDLREALITDHEAPRTWYSGESYNDTSAPLRTYPRGRVLTIDPALISGNEATLDVTPPPGRAPFMVNLGAASRIVEIKGLERLGRDARGFAVVRRPAEGSGPLRVTIRLAGATITAGRVISLLAILALAAIALGAALRGLRARRVLTACSDR